MITIQAYVVYDGYSNPLIFFFDFNKAKDYCIKYQPRGCAWYVKSMNINKNPLQNNQHVPLR